MEDSQHFQNGSDHGASGKRSTENQDTPEDIKIPAKCAVHVLVVEDHEYNKIVIAQILKLLGHTYEVASNGMEALEVLKVHDFDLILMDLRMPELDGFNTTARIRTDPEFSDKASIPIVALTAHAMDFHRVKCLQTGMNDFIPKPIDIKTLQRVLDAFSPATINKP